MRNRRQLKKQIHTIVRYTSKIYGDFVLLRSYGDSQHSLSLQILFFVFLVAVQIDGAVQPPMGMPPSQIIC